MTKTRKAAGKKAAPKKKAAKKKAVGKCNTPKQAAGASGLPSQIVLYDGE